MGQLFSPSPGPETLRLEDEAQLLQDSVQAAKQEMADILATQDAINRARLHWFNDQAEKIGVSYTGLIHAFDSGSPRTAYKFLTGIDRDIARAVLSIKVPALDGTEKTFLDMCEDSFSGQTVSSLKRTIEEYLNGPITPPFDGIKGKGERLPPKMSVIRDRSVFGVMTGRYDNHLKGKILGFKAELENIAREKERQLSARQTGLNENLSASLRAIGNNTRLGLMETRLDAALLSPSAEILPLVERAIHYFQNIGGAKAVTDWLSGAAWQDGPPRLQFLLTRAYDNPEEQTAILQTMLGIFPDNLARAHFLSAAAAQMGDTAQSAAFKALAFGYVGDTVLVDSNTALMPGQSGFISYDKNSGQLTAARAGLNETFTVREETAMKLLDLAQTQQGFFRLREIEVENPAQLDFSRCQSDNGGRIILHTQYSGENWQMPAEQAVANRQLDLRAARPGFIQFNNKEVLNASRADVAWQETQGNGNYRITAVIAEKKYDIENIDQRQIARSHLDTMVNSAQGGEYLLGTLMVRVPRIANAWISKQTKDGTCRLNFIIGSKQYNTTMATGEALDRLKNWVEHAGFVALGEQEVINPAQLGSAFVFTAKNAGDSDQLCYLIDGKKVTTDMPRSQALAVLKKLAADHGFIMHHASAALNPLNTTSIYYGAGTLYYQTGNERWQSDNFSKESAAALFNTLAARRDYIGLNSEFYLNMNKPGWVVYKDDKLRFPADGKLTDEVPAVPMTHEKAHEVLAALELHGAGRAVERNDGVCPTAPGRGGLLSALFASHAAAFVPVPGMTPPVPELEAGPEPEAPPVLEAPEKLPAVPHAPRRQSSAMTDFLKFKI